MAPQIADTNSYRPEPVMCSEGRGTTVTAASQRGAACDEEGKQAGRREGEVCAGLPGQFSRAD